MIHHFLGKKTLLLLCSITFSAKGFLKYPSFYDNGDKKVRLFLSTSCHHCSEALEKLIKIINQKRKFNAKIYFFSNDDTETLQLCKFFLAARSDLNLVKELMKMCMKYNFKTIKTFAENHPTIKSELEKSKVEIDLWLKTSKKSFDNNKVERTPTWIINEKRIEVIPDNIEKTLKE